MYYKLNLLAILEVNLYWGLYCGEGCMIWSLPPILYNYNTVDW